MKRYKYILPLLLILFFVSCSSASEFKIKVTNPSSSSLQDAYIITEINSNSMAFILLDGEKEIPCQVLETNGKRQIVFVLDLEPNEVKTLTLKETDKAKEYPPRAYAELSMKPGNIYFGGKFRGDKFVNVTKIKVPKIHTDHDALFRYEGPGWESEKVGYRFYLDWRNASDIFGKKVNKLLLANVGVHDTVAKDDSYHSMLDWGMDIFNVGGSLGIGSIGMWLDGKVNMVSKTDSVFCEIPYNGPIISGVKTSYYGWQVGDKKYDIVSELSIAAGSRLTKCKINISDTPEDIVTGLAKHDGTNFVKFTAEDNWSYIALYGKQTLVNPDDELGIALFYRGDDLIELTEDDLSYVVKLKPTNGKVEYYFSAAWDQEPDGIKNFSQFMEYLDKTVERLNQSPIVAIN